MTDISITAYTEPDNGKCMPESMPVLHKGKCYSTSNKDDCDKLGMDAKYISDKNICIGIISKEWCDEKRWKYNEKDGTCTSPVKIKINWAMIIVVIVVIIGLIVLINKIRKKSTDVNI